MVDDVGIVQHADGIVPLRASGYCTDDVARLAIVALGLSQTTGAEAYHRMLARSLGFLRHAWSAERARHAQLHVLRPPLARRAARRRPPRARRLGARARSSAAEPVRALREPSLDPAARDAAGARRAALAAHDGLRRARPRPRRPRRARRRRAQRPARPRRTARRPAARQRVAGLVLGRGRPGLRQRAAPAGADRRRRPARRRARWCARACASLDWYAGELGIDGPCLRLVGHRGRAPRRAAGPARATSSRSTPPRSSRPRSRPSSSPATSSRARHAVRAFEWFLGRNRLQRSVYDFSTGGCHDGLGESDVNGNEGAESTLAYLQALLALDARRPPDDAARMKLALLGPIAWRTPPRHYGPWELVTGLLADGLAQRGVDVTLFATLDSITLARLDGVCERPYEEDDDDRRARLGGAPRRARARAARRVRPDPQPPRLAAARAFGPGPRADGHDDPRVLLAADPAGLPRVRAAPSSRSPTPTARPELDYVATVHHGVDTTALPFSATAGDGLVCFGRIHPDKGTAQAIEIARRAERPLVLCGPVQDERYFAEEVEPHVDGDRVRYLGSVGHAERAAVLGAASCLLHPIAFAEPFGLSVVESMLCGTPVVAYARGSMPELVEDGVTGVLAARRRLGGRGRGARRAASTAPRAAARPSAASPPTAWSTTTSTSTKGSSVTDSAIAVHPPPRQSAAVAGALAVLDQRGHERGRDDASATRRCCCAASRTGAASRT